MSFQNLLRREIGTHYSGYSPSTWSRLLQFCLRFLAASPLTELLRLSCSFDCRVGVGGEARYSADEYGIVSQLVAHSSAQPVPCEETVSLSPSCQPFTELR